MFEIKTKDNYEYFSSDRQMFEFGNYSTKCNKEMFEFGNYSTKSKYYDNSNKLAIGKMKNETAGVEIKKFVGMKP